MTNDIERTVAKLSPMVKRAVLMAPFNSKGSGIRGGALVKWNVGNSHLSGGDPALFVRTMRSNFSGDYDLTPFGLAVRAHLEARG